jgi:hypothetical protein
MEVRSLVAANSSAADAAAGEVEDAHLAAVEHSQFKVAVERRGIRCAPGWLAKR